MIPRCVFKSSCGGPSMPAAPLMLPTRNPTAAPRRTFSRYSLPNGAVWSPPVKRAEMKDFARWPGFLGSDRTIASAIPANAPPIPDSSMFAASPPTGCPITACKSVKTVPRTIRTAHHVAQHTHTIAPTPRRPVIGPDGTETPPPPSVWVISTVCHDQRVVLARFPSERRRKLLQRRQIPIHIFLCMLHRQQPLLALAPRRQKHPAIVLHQPRRIRVATVQPLNLLIIARHPLGVGDLPLRPHRHHLRREPVPRHDLPRPFLHAAPQPVEVRVRFRCHHLGEHRPRRRHRQRIAVHRPHLLVAAAGDLFHDLWRGADRPYRQPATECLGETDDVGLHPQQPRGAAWMDR